MSWLRCRIYPGQFSGEYVAQGHYFDSSLFSVIVSESNLNFSGEKPVNGGFVEGFLQITPVEKLGDQVLVRLPQPAVENGLLVTVQADSIKEGDKKNDSFQP